MGQHSKAFESSIHFQKARKPFHLKYMFISLNKQQTRNAIIGFTLKCLMNNAGCVPLNLKSRLTLLQKRMAHQNSQAEVISDSSDEYTTENKGKKNSIIKTLFPASIGLRVQTYVHSHRLKVHFAMDSSRYLQFIINFESQPFKSNPLRKSSAVRYTWN